MKIEIFSLERTQSLWENTVKYNLTDSGVHPFTLRELLTEEEIESLLSLRLGYGQTNGSIELREAITQLYQGSNLDNILVTNGTAEANFVMSWLLLEPNDEVLYMQPNYNQIGGLAQCFGAKVKNFYLYEKLGWQPSLAEIEEKISPRTKLIALCNPNNPTGSILNPSIAENIINLASRVGAYLYVDEIYRGSELEGRETETFWGKYDKVIIGAGLSKAYALPGLRLGWLIGPSDFISKAWAYHDYTSITAGIISHYLGALVLQPNRRKTILERNRQILKNNLEILTSWMSNFPHLFSLVPPKAGGMAFLKYHFSMNSTKLSNRLREEKSVFVVPGDCFGLDGYIRIGIGANPFLLKEGLAIFKDWLQKNLNS
ncbi:MAG: aminotransferase class I/II-fold pyridoxal phosphate-dependent enzyme [Candidatus Aminicenantes bacterium]|nr:aminotransferase class I/II-fold pyridoxal phosphate-dependent enzyme [Candidatus Aminicenantes bacterium]